MKKIMTILTLSFLSGCYLSEELPADQQVWKYGQPDAVGLDEEGLLELNSMISTGEYGSISGLIIIKNGRMVFENYYSQSSRSQINPIGKTTFAITTMLLNSFIADGYIPNLDAPIHPYLPEYASVFEQTPAKKDITFRHLLTHKSGLVWNESQVNMQRGTSDFMKMKQTADWTAYILNKKLDAIPGTRGTVNSASGIILMQIYQHLLGEESVQEYIKRKLLDPLSITDYKWDLTGTGLPDGATGLHLSTIDLTKIGYLVLLEGQWPGQNRVLDRDWVLETTAPQQEVTFDYSYGFGWWLFTDSFVERQLSETYRTLFLSGEAGQSLYVLPEEDIVICVMAENYYYGAVINPSLMIFLNSLRTTEPSSLN